MKSEKLILNGKIIDRVTFPGNIVRIRIQNQFIAGNAKPGQFINIRTAETGIPLLRRPFSIHRVNRDESWFEVLFQIIGPGTTLISKFHIGKEIDFLGLLGNSFNVSRKVKKAILVAGGLGIAPLLFLNQTLKKMKIPVLLFWGNRSANGFCCLEDFKELDTMYYCATDDGSFGTKGNVIDLMQRHISEFEDENLVIYSCGPNPMLNRLKSFAGDHDIECQFSLETMMACGFGVCLGCNVKSAHDPGIYKYVCNNGPVFNANEIDLSE